MNSSGVGNCIGTYPGVQYRPSTYPYYYGNHLNKLGEFDLHLDSCGNLRVIHQGKIVGEFKPKAKDRALKCFEDKKDE